MSEQIERVAIEERRELIENLDWAPAFVYGIEDEATRLGTCFRFDSISSSSFPTGLLVSELTSLRSALRPV